MYPSVRCGTVLAIASLLVACQSAAPPPTQRQAGAAPAAEAPAPAAPASRSAGPTRVAIGVTEAVESQNPYADTVSLLYGIWCEVLGCLVSYDFKTGDYAPGLAESWRVEDPTTWIFNLRRGVTWHDGSPFTAADVLHSFNRIANDPGSRQKSNISPVVERVEIVDDHTIKVITKTPTAPLLDYFKELVAITSKAQYDQYGDDVWKEKPLGTGPYIFKELVPNQYLVIAKNPNWWGGAVDGPDEVVYRVMREPEVRATALLNGEIQIAQSVPPHMAERITAAPAKKIVTADTVEIMFLAMSPRTKPWDNKLVRQAVAYAIDRDAIIDGVFHGQAIRLDGPIGPGQYAYQPDLQPRYTYDPERARQLLAQAGYPTGLDVEFFTPVGRYTQDKQAAEAMTAMLNAVGIRARLLTSEWPTLWADVQVGKVPFYYMGRGSVLDPGRPLSEYFESGVSPRVGYSNPALDALFVKERGSFDPNERKKVLSDLLSLLTEEAPAHFLWRHKMLWGMAQNVDYTPRPDGRVFGRDIRLSQ
jgi:peptide/nickel transport system substrate-binding protein